jgi:hypothetical protein
MKSWRECSAHEEIRRMELIKESKDDWLTQILLFLHSPAALLPVGAVFVAVFQKTFE